MITKIKLLALVGLISLVSCSSKSKDPINNPIETRQLKVLAFNIQHGAPQGSSVNNLGNTAATIKASGAELVALQEVDVNTTRSGVDVNQAKVLAEMTGMHYYFSKSIDFQGGDYGVAVLSKHPILATNRIELPNIAPGGEQRSIAYVTVEMPDKTKVDFASVHLDLKFDNRKEQIEILNDLGRTAPNPLIVAGDFNAEPKDSEMLLINKSFTYPCNESCPLTFPANKATKTIDYIVMNGSASKKFKALSYLSLTNQKTSDHLPLLGVYVY